jgi:hypothetical protein
MGIFLATPLISSNKAFDDSVISEITVGDRYKLQSDRGWLIKYSGTTTELSNLLKLTGQPQGQASPLGSGIIVSITTYYGRGPIEMWEWLKTRFEQ